MCLLITKYNYLNLQHQSSRNKYTFESPPCFCSNKVQVYVFIHAVVAFMLLKQTAELVHVQLVEAVELLGCWLLVLLHCDWTSDCREVQDNTLRVSVLYDAVGGQVT